jgi:hypothetical protein
MGEWVNKVQVHKHDMPLTYGLTNRRTPIQVGSTWRCACGLVFKVSSARRISDQREGDYQTLEWEPRLSVVADWRD